MVVNLWNLINQYSKKDSQISCSMYENCSLEILIKIKTKMLKMYKLRKICFAKNAFKIHCDMSFSLLILEEVSQYTFGQVYDKKLLFFSVNCIELCKNYTLIAWLEKEIISINILLDEKRSFPISLHSFDFIAVLLKLSLNYLIKI